MFVRLQGAERIRTAVYEQTTCCRGIEGGEATTE